METKITRKEMFEMIKGACADNEVIVEFCDKNIEMLSKKSTKPNKKQVRNIELAEEVYNFMVANNHPAKAKEIVEGMEHEEITSTQKLTAIMKILITDGRVAKVEDKKDTFYSIVSAE